MHNSQGKPPSLSSPFLKRENPIKEEVINGDSNLSKKFKSATENENRNGNKNKSRHMETVIVDLTDD